MYPTVLRKPCTWLGCLTCPRTEPFRARALRNRPTILSLGSMLRILGFGVALLAVGCGGGDEVPNPGCGGESVGASAAKDPTPVTTPVCEAGKVAACPCAGTAVQGTQACADDGSKWEACSCPDPVSSPMQECSNVMDQSGLNGADRCGSGQVMYHTCSKAIVDRGICSIKTFGVSFCCPADL